LGSYTVVSQQRPAVLLVDGGGVPWVPLRMPVRSLVRPSTWSQDGEVPSAAVDVLAGELAGVSMQWRARVLRSRTGGELEGDAAVNDDDGPHRRAVGRVAHHPVGHVVAAAVGFMVVDAVVGAW